MSRLPPLRYLPLLLVSGGALLTAGLGLLATPGWFAAAAPLGLLTALGITDLMQRRRSLRRNYPLLAHLRFALESIGPEIRQYFIEADTDERPFSREQRAVVYQRAKGSLDKRPFGTLLDPYAAGYEWMGHSTTSREPADEDFRILVGSTRAKPFRASVFNISAMSFGSLSANATRALNLGALQGDFYPDTGEGGISRYHLEAGGDLVWEIGSGYFGCRSVAGGFDADSFAGNAARPAVRMIEIKLSQGAKPGHGGILPGAKVTDEIAAARAVPAGQDVISPAHHSMFSTPGGLLDFVVQLRELSGDKPVGIKLAIGHPVEWFALVKAMLERDIVPDFIVVDGAEGGTGAAPLELINRMGMPVDDAVHLVHNTLRGCGLRCRTRIASAGKVTTAFKLARQLALGADWCNAGRGFMFALGCIQSLSCHTDHCPTGIATQDPWRNRSLDPATKANRVANFHKHTVRALAQLLDAAGLAHPDELSANHILRRLPDQRVASFAELFPCLAEGAMLEGVDYPAPFTEAWKDARSDRFFTA